MIRRYRHFIEVEIRFGNTAKPHELRVAWWNTSHRKIVKFIDERYNGAWDSYIECWVNYQRKMQRILDEDGTDPFGARFVRQPAIDQIGIRVSTARTPAFRTVDHDPITAYLRSRP